jgi:ABC-type transport system substrate-binding protein
MKRGVNDGGKMGLWCVIGLLVTVTSVSAGTPAPQAAAKPNIERLRIAIAPLGYDTNFTWLEARSGHLDKRPALEYLIGIDRHSGAYIPELAEKWEMSPDGKTWRITLRKGVTFHDDWGEFTAKDVRHAVFLITQPESVQADAGTWRALMGIGKADTIEDVARRVAEGVESVDNYTVVFHLTSAAPEFLETLSTNTDLMMESKARWDAGGKELYGRKVVGTGPFEFVERMVSSHVLYKRVDNHWRKTPEYKELEFRGCRKARPDWRPCSPMRSTSLMLSARCRRMRWPRGCRFSRATCRPFSTSGTSEGCTLPARRSWTPRCPLWTSGCGRR